MGIDVARYERAAAATAAAQENFGARKGDFAVVELVSSMTFAFGTGRGIEHYSRFVPCLVARCDRSGTVQALESLIDGSRIAVDRRGVAPWSRAFGCRIVARDKIGDAEAMSAEFRATFGSSGAPEQVEPIVAIFRKHKRAGV